MDAYSFDDGALRHQTRAGILKERLRSSGYRFQSKPSVQTNQHEKRVKIQKDKPNKVVRNPIKIGSDCSGLGTEVFGMDVLGLRHRVIHEFGSESNKTRRGVFERLHPGCKKVYASCLVKDRSLTCVPTVDLYVAGGECPPWLMAGKRQGLNDKGGKNGCNRGKVMLDIISYIETRKPKTFILEQVEGMLKGARNGRI